MPVAASRTFWMLLAFGAMAHGAPATLGRDVAPIVYRDCAPCHRPGESGPFPLLAYPDVHKHAQQIADVTRSRYMPPWLPEAGHGEFEGERRLTDAEIRTIADWVAQGAPEGPPAEIPPLPAFVDGWQLGAPDMVLEAPAAYRLAASGPDEYWNFVLRPNVTAPRYVRAVEILPGDRRVIHHANLLLDRLGSAHRQEASPGSGFGGMDVTLMRSPFDPEGNFVFWKPGAPPPVERDRQLVEVTPRDASAHNDYGIALLKLGDRTDAVAEFDRALEIEPANEAVKANREEAIRGK